LALERKSKGPIGVPVQLWFGVEVTILRCHMNLQLELLKCPAELPVNWHSLTIVGYTGSLNVSPKPVFNKLKSLTQFLLYPSSGKSLVLKG
jgi:hypothetical protein